MHTAKAASLEPRASTQTVQGVPTSKSSSSRGTAGSTTLQLPGRVGKPASSQTTDGGQGCSGYMCCSLRACAAAHACRRGWAQPECRRDGNAGMQLRTAAPAPSAGGAAPGWRWPPALPAHLPALHTPAGTATAKHQNELQGGQPAKQQAPGLNSSNCGRGASVAVRCRG